MTSALYVDCYIKLMQNSSRPDERMAGATRLAHHHAMLSEDCRGPLSSLSLDSSSDNVPSTVTALLVSEPGDGDLSLAQRAELHVLVPVPCIRFSTALGRCC